MPDDLETNLDERVDLPGEGLRALDDVDRAEDLKDRQAAASPESAEPEGEEEDFLTQKFIYTGPDGQEVELTGQELLDARERTAALEAENAALKAPKETPAKEPEKQPDDTVSVEPVQYDKVGKNFIEMLEDESRHAEIGPQLSDFQFREFMTNPRYAQVLVSAVESIIERREGSVKSEQGFREFVGAEPSKAEVQAFMQANPFIQTEREAILSMQLAAEKNRGATAGADKDKAHQEGVKKGQDKALRDLKAKGQLRRVGGTGSRATAAKPTFNPKDPNQRLAAAVASLEKGRN